MAAWASGNGTYTRRSFSWRPDLMSIQQHSLVLDYYIFAIVASWSFVSQLSACTGTIRSPSHRSVLEGLFLASRSHPQPPWRASRRWQPRVRRRGTAPRRCGRPSAARRLWLYWWAVEQRGAQSMVGGAYAKLHQRWQHGRFTGPRLSE